jgi:chorismate mutase/prephenate dehydratase
MPNPKDAFARIHASLEAADDAVVEGLDARARAMRELVALKQRDPEGYYALPRDEEILAKAIELAKDFPREGVAAVFREVLSASARVVAEVSVAFLGPEGAFAHVAARERFGRAAELRAVDSVNAVLEEVERGRARFGIVPLESSSDGTLTATLAGLLDAEVWICGELTIPASYHLVSHSGNPADVEKVYGAPAAIAASERYVRTAFPRAVVIDVPSGAIAAQFARDDHGAAAVATSVAADMHGLTVVRERVEDVSGVELRFAVIGKDHPPRTGKDRTVAALAVHDEPGALYKALQPFADRGINLTRLESRQGRGTTGRTVFFVELDGHVTDRPVITALEELRTTTRFVKILGSYPRP